MKNYKSPEIKFSVFDEEVLIMASSNKEVDTTEDKLDSGNFSTVPDEDVFGN